MTRLIWGAITGALAGLAFACTANKQPSKIETTLANMAKDVVIPIEAQSVKNPLPNNDQIVQQGEQIYMGSCGMCHAMDGHARTDLGRSMYPPAMDLTSPHVQHWTDAELFWIIQNGVRLTGMPSWKSIISETDTWKLVRFIQNLPRLDAKSQALRAAPAPAKSEAELVAYGKTLYRQEGCFMCHLLNGEGGKVGPDLTVEGRRGRRREWLIGHFKNPPAYTAGSMMPAFTNLTDEQLAALSTFLLNQKQEGR
jgi:mono/diheme cytochrome c family protein